MKNISHLLSIIILLAIGITACGSSVGDGLATPPAEIDNSPTDVGHAPAEPFISAPGLGMITLSTVTSGAGEKPLFGWDAVAGADRYQLIVFDEAGEPYWAWEGAVTQIYLGGTDAQPSADSNGPTIAAGYSWAVVAYGADGKVLASSEKRSISP